MNPFREITAAPVWDCTTHSRLLNIDESASSGVSFVYMGVHSLAHRKYQHLETLSQVGNLIAHQPINRPIPALVMMADYDDTPHRL